MVPLHTQGCDVKQGTKLRGVPWCGYRGTDVLGLRDAQAEAASDAVLAPGCTQDCRI